MFLFLHSVDIYETHFHFTTEYKEKFKTEFGGILSIISFIIILFSKKNKQKTIKIKRKIKQKN